MSKDANTCLPTWGTAYGMQNYAQYSKIKALREAGGDVMLSIGGANNAPLAASCKNVDDLMQHYYDIVDNLNLKVPTSISKAPGLRIRHLLNVVTLL